MEQVPNQEWAKSVIHPPDGRQECRLFGTASSLSRSSVFPQREQPLTGKGVGNLLIIKRWRAAGKANRLKRSRLKSLTHPRSLVSNSPPKRQHVTVSWKACACLAKMCSSNSKKPKIHGIANFLKIPSPISIER